jgi:hypothetical protein
MMREDVSRGFLQGIFDEPDFLSGQTTLRFLFQVEQGGGDPDRI